jgi:hypothetical protein
MTPADFYRQRAAECLVLAQQVSDPQEREVVRKLASYWLRLLGRAPSRREGEASSPA